MPKLKSHEDILMLRKAGKLAAHTLRHVGSFVKPGISTEELDKITHDYILSHNAYPSPLNYLGYPKSVCTSINDVICHGIPSHDEILKEGDIVNIDVTVTLDGYFGDCSRTFMVGNNIPEERVKLTRITEESLARAIVMAKHGNRIGDIGHAIQSYAEKEGCGVVRDFVGHGIGKIFHEKDLQIPHFGKKGTGLKIVRGMVFTIEPMINTGDWRSRLLSDGWTAKTVDGKDSAQFEHTLAIVGEGVEILTALEDDPIAIRAKELGANVLWPVLG
ncbi:MAG: type I methionyl aminopeptidase [Bdellovibrionota bacterium]